MDKKRFLLISTGVLAGALIFMGYQIKIPYKQQLSTQQGITNTVSVAGEGKAYATPDTLLINISISELGKTTKESQDLANAKVTKLKDMLKTFDIKKENIQTTNVNMYAEYDRGTNNQKKLLGYRSQQSISIKVQGENFSVKGGDIINKIAEIGRINVDGVNFTLEDKNPVMQEAREKAFNDAKIKAEQLARLGGLELGKPTMISDQEVSYTPGPIYYAKTASMGAGDTAMNNNELSAGQLEISINLNIIYELK